MASGPLQGPLREVQWMSLSSCHTAVQGLRLWQFSLFCILLHSLSTMYSHGFRSERLKWNHCPRYGILSLSLGNLSHLLMSFVLITWYWLCGCLRYTSSTESFVLRDRYFILRKEKNILWSVQESILSCCINTDRIIWQKIFCEVH